MELSRWSHVGNHGLLDAIGYLSLSLITLCLTACREEDRILTVTCKIPDGATVSAEFGASDSTGEQIGLLNTFQFSPGAILQLEPAASIGSLGRGRLAYGLQTSDRDYLPLHLQSWGGKAVGVSFNIQSDDEDQSFLNSLNRELKKTIEDNTFMWAWGAKRKVLGNPVGLVNADSGAVDIVRTGAETTRFVIVSAVSYGTNVALGYSGDSVAVNTLKDGRVYFHLKYTCPVLTKMTVLVKSSGGKAPLVFFYVPITYDRGRRLVQVDSRRIDLTKFAFPQG
jgi:hypothetical protein